MKRFLGIIITVMVIGFTVIACNIDNTDGLGNQNSGTLVPGVNLAAKLQWLGENAQSDTEYLVEVDTDMVIAPYVLSFSGKSGITITLKGTGAERASSVVERTISLIENGTIFDIGEGVTLVAAENITLTGNGTNTEALVYVNNGGTFVMKDGAKIINNKQRGVTVNGENAVFVMDGGEITDNYHSTSSSAYGGGVYVWYGTFTMNGGLIARNICDNTLSYGGGVYVTGETGTFTMNDGTISYNEVLWGGAGGGVSIDSATFTMNGGTISGNRTIAVSGETVYSQGDGGGVSTNGGTFIMNGGTIKSNTAGYGGGVRIHSGIFDVSGGVIYGADGGLNANSASEADRGNAIYVYSYGGYVHRETTVGAGERLFVSHNPQTAEGVWEEY